MIVKMFKTTLLCLASDKEHALKKLQELGVMHVEVTRKADSEDRTEVEHAVNQLERAVNSLAGRTTDVESIDHTGREIAEKTLELLDEGTAFNKRLETLKRDLDKLEPWGDFSNETIAELEKSGIRVYLCTGSESDLEACGEKGTCEIIREDKGRYNFALIATEEQDEAALPLASIPEDISLNKCLEEIAVCRRELERINKALDKMSAGLDQVKEYALEVQEKLEFLTSRDGMIHEGEIAYIEGFVPQPEIENLKAEAQESGWALLINQPEKGDNVPTLIKTPKIFDIAKPIFEFIGIAPGYNEWDISVCFLFFFTIFFAMIVGDAGYGIVFLVLALICKGVIKNEKAKLPLNLFMTLSIATIVWGALNSCYFGIDANLLPGFMQAPGKFMEKLPTWVKGVDQYKDLPGSEIKDKNVQYFCFLLAAIHLSLARFWKLILYWKNAITDALGALGWGLFLWGNFFLAVNLIVFSGSMPNFAYWLYGVGFVLILFGVNWKDAGDLLNFPFAIIGSFVDVLSYIRLFAVGLSSYYIATSFNNMGLMLAKISPWLIIGTVFIILIGHLLNIALAFMGVLVHGIRLNTLEFSNHMELQWLGIVYKPFKKLATNQIKEKK